ncbi:hypothetical protein ACQB6R_13850 [Propionibacteriaceae bacterium G1746]|uniref:hypothetical protein n=1 Tax=Aestuariimicrobium sp. G57 TaxID=3418485 RepID=UPI003C22726C
MVDVTGVDVTFAVPDGTCAPVNDVTIPAGGAVDVFYTCVFTSATAASSGQVVATVDVGATTLTLPAAFDFSGVAPVVTDDTVTVDDPLAGLSRTITAADGEGKLAYQLTFTAAEGCAAFENIASLTDDQQPVTANQLVTVCGQKEYRPPSLPNTGLGG